MTKDYDVPQPGPARLSPGAGPDEWLDAAKRCKYLPEADMKRLCEIVKECLMEGARRRLYEGLARMLMRCRVQHPARQDPGHRLRRYPRPVL